MKDVGEVAQITDSGFDKKKMNVEVDKLSSLPDCLIHKILSLFRTKHVVQTSVLSSRWRYTWTSMPYLDFSNEDFTTLHKFSQFVNHVLSDRNNEIEVSTLKLRFRGDVNQVFVKRVVNYAVSHNVQQMSVTCFLENDTEFPLPLFSSQSVKHLSLRFNRFYITPTSTWELPALTTLYLSNVILCDDDSEKCVAVFSKCANLKNLTLKRYKTMGSDGFTIRHPQLSNLKLKNKEFYVKAVNVVAPQLENLFIKSRSHECQHLVSAPNLTSLVYKGDHPLQLNTDGFHLLDKAHICFPCTFYVKVENIVSLLQQLYSVKSLTLNLEIVEVLSSSKELIPHQPSPFASLKSLTIYPEKVEKRELPKEKVTISTEVKNYLLDDCPGATFTMVSHEETLALRNATTAKKRMTKLRVFIVQEKYDYEARRAQIDRGKAPMENHNATVHVDEKQQSEEQMQLQFVGSMELIKSSWKDLSVQIEENKRKAWHIIHELQSIKDLVAQLPASNWAMIQPYFSSLCAEVDIFMNKMTDDMKIQCDENQSRSSVCFHELATHSSYLLSKYF